MLRVMIDHVFSGHHDHSAMLQAGPPPAAVHWVLRAAAPGGRVVSVEPLKGGISHANHVIRIDVGGASLEVVLRRWVHGCPQEAETGFSAEREAATYGLLASSAVPAPRLLAADADGRECDVPALLLTREPGTAPVKPADMRSFVAQLAAALPPIHSIDPVTAERALPPYRPYYDADDLRPPGWARSASTWERAIEAVAEGRSAAHGPDETARAARATPSAPLGPQETPRAPGPAATRAVEPEPQETLRAAPAATRAAATRAASTRAAEPAAFIHRDYHPGNTLWASGSLSSIVDWTTASWGPPAVDVAHMRANLVMSFDIEVADAFLRAYRAMIGASYIHDPCWDLRVAVDFLPELSSQSRPEFDRLDDFVARAVAALA